MPVFQTKKLYIGKCINSCKSVFWFRNSQNTAKIKYCGLWFEAIINIHSRSAVKCRQIVMGFFTVSKSKIDVFGWIEPGFAEKLVQKNISAKFMVLG